FAADLKALSAAKADLVWAPSAEVMYPAGFATRIEPQGAAKAGLEDKFRPHFFGGVATVVAKLFTQTAPDFALFGEKDYQQLRVVTQMAQDLDLAVKVIGVPTVREQDGLARARLDQHQFAVEHHAAAADAVFVGERADVEDALAAADLAADHPKKRAAVGQLIGALGHHAGGVDVLEFLPAPLLLFEFFFDPVFQVGDRVAADAQLDEMKRHCGIPNYSFTGSITITLASSATCASATTAISATVPSIGAVKVCSIFIASMMARRCPRLTRSPCSTKSARTLPCMGARTSPPAASSPASSR